jgi:hypothetical protein
VKDDFISGTVVYQDISHQQSIIQFVDVMEQLVA